MSYRNRRIRKYELTISKDLKLVQEGISKAISEAKQMGAIEIMWSDIPGYHLIVQFKKLTLIGNVRPLSMQLTLSRKSVSDSTLIKFSIIYTLSRPSSRSILFHSIFGKYQLDNCIMFYACNFKQKVEVWL